MWFINILRSGRHSQPLAGAKIQVVRQINQPSDWEYKIKEKICSQSWSFKSNAHLNEVRPCPVIRSRRLTPSSSEGTGPPGSEGSP